MLIGSFMGQSAKPHYLTSKIFPFMTEANQKTLPDEQVRKLGLLYSSYRFITSVFLFMSSHVLIFSNSRITLALPSLLHQSVLLFYSLFSLLLLAFFLVIRSGYSNQLALGLTLDVLVISILLYINGQPDIQLVVLYMVVVAVSFMLLVSYQAVIITMLAIIFVIYQQFFQAITSDMNLRNFGEALLMSLSFICVAFLSWSISQRLVQVEQIAANTASQVTKLNAITQEVISTMQQGILVFDAQKKLMISNHASSVLLGLQLEHPEPSDNNTLSLIDKNKELDTVDFIYSSNHLIESAITDEHAELLSWLNHVPSHKPSQLIYPLPKPTSKLDKLRVSTTPMQDGIVLVMIEDLRREQTNAQQLKLASLGQLTASIAHEIRNPLAAISQASELLMDDEDWGSDKNEKTPDPNIELYRMIFNQTKRVNRIIEDVLKLSRQAKPEQIKLDIVPWLEKFIDNHYRGHDIFLHPKNSPSVYFDPHQLEQILINLVNNGLRFCSKAHPHAFVEIEVFLQENDVILDVLDTGNGVPVDKQEDLFLPFFTTDNEGTGLGLYLSQAFAEANFARLVHVAEHPKTCFRLIIPQAMADSPLK